MRETDWSRRWSSSTLQSINCNDCGRLFDAWNYLLRCEICAEKLAERIANGEQFGPAFHTRGLYRNRQHSIETVDGKTYYHDEWGEKKIYERYRDYEEQEKKPAMQKAYEQYERMNPKQKELDASL